jgi:hypothetical protein
MYSIKYLETCGIEKLDNVEVKESYVSAKYPHSPNSTILYLGKEIFTTFEEAKEAAISKLQNTVRLMRKKMDRLENQLKTLTNTKG